MRRNKSIIRGIPGDETIHYRYNGQMECIFIKDIAFVKSAGVYAMIYCIAMGRIDKKMICRTVKNMEKLLKDKNFIRCHKYYLINLSKVECFCSRSKFLTICGNQLPVSRRNSVWIFPILLKMGIKDVSEHTANKV